MSVERVIVDGLQNPATGIGVVQARLYPRLAGMGKLLIAKPSRDRGDSLAGRVQGLFVGYFWRSSFKHPRLLVCPPYPMFARGRTVAVIHDLRWRRTRQGISRLYRSVDLKRTVRRSDVLVCISERTRKDLIDFVPGSSRKIVVALEGPGIVEKVEFPDPVRGRVLLVGRADHKRNEVALEALAAARPPWCSEIVGVNLSDDAKSIALRGFPNACFFYENLSEVELRNHYLEAETFVFLGLEEGFGLPFIEALASGCNVVCVEQELTHELLGRAGSYLPNGSLEDLAKALRTVSFPGADVRRQHAERYSWDKFAEAVARALT